MNYSLAAKHFGTTRAQIVRVVQRFPKDAQALKDEYLDLLAEQVHLVPLGQATEGFRLKEALQTLAMERPTEWGSAKDRAAAAPPPEPDITPFASNYVVHGQDEWIESRRPERKPETIRVDDAPGRFLEDNLERGAGRMDQDI